MGDFLIPIMTDNSIFRSRTARLSCSQEDFFKFITDLRNFSEFIKHDLVQEWEASADSCRLRIQPVGEIKLKITNREPFSSVTFSGDALQKNEFNIDALISDKGNSMAEVELVVRADLNPFLKMMAAGPIEQFLEKMVAEMEKYNGWKK